MRLAGGLLKEWGYETEKFKYTETLARTYTPDFILGDVWFEAKGYFRTAAEARKYVAIKAAYPEKRIVFIFSDPRKRAYPQCRRRNDGTVMSMAEYVEKYEFEWCTEATLEEFINDNL